MKKLLIIGVIVLAGLWVFKRTHIASYAGTIWSAVRQEAKNQVPTKFELDRIRHEIAQMDGDIRGMVSPIAEHMATISKLRRDLDTNRNTLTGQKAGLLTLTTSLKDGVDPVVIDGQRFSAERARQKMDRDFRSYKLLQTQVATQEKLLVAKEKALDGVREKLNKLISKKRDFEVRLAQLEAEQQLLEAASTGTDLRVDDGRATEIQAAINDIERRQEVQRNTLILLNQGVATDPLPAADQGGATADEVRNYLQGEAAHNGTKTASRK
jgi:hypothetical protein